MKHDQKFDFWFENPDEETMFEGLWTKKNWDLSGPIHTPIESSYLWQLKQRYGGLFMSVRFFSDLVEFKFTN